MKKPIQTYIAGLMCGCILTLLWVPRERHDRYNFDRYSLHIGAIYGYLLAITNNPPT